jgi:transcriptional regulator with AAA-type ATPase domain
VSTLTEIENAVSSLPPIQQENLLRWLETRINSRSGPNSGRVSRDEWLSNLAKLRETGRTARQGPPLQQVMDDLRGA